MDAPTRTHGQLQTAILQRLTLWQCQDPLLPVQGNRSLKAAIHDQDQLGWENFLMGRIAPSLGAYQQVHYTHTGSRRTGDSWTSQLITQLWQVMWKMWEHRNQINSSGLTAQDLRERANLLGRIHQEFSKGRASLNPEDRDLLGNQQAICKWSNPEIQDWLEKLHHARAACSRRVDTQARDLLHSQRCMARWLATVSHSAPDPAPPPEAVEPPPGPAASTR